MSICVQYSSTINATQSWGRGTGHHTNWKTMFRLRIRHFQKVIEVIVEVRVGLIPIITPITIHQYNINKKSHRWYILEVRRVAIIQSIAPKSMTIHRGDSWGEEGGHHTTCKTMFKTIQLFQVTEVLDSWGEEGGHYTKHNTYKYDNTQRWQLRWGGWPIYNA